MSRRPFSWTNEEFYQQMSTAQLSVVNELSLSSLVARVNHCSSSTLAEVLLDQLVLFKRYFTWQLFLCSRPPDSQDECPWDFPRSPLYRLFLLAEPKKSQHSCIRDHAEIDSAAVARRCLTETSPVAIDILTFGVLPSLHHFFLLKRAAAEFIDFLRLQEAHRPAFARAMFCTPAFVAFARDCFYEVLRPYFTGGATRIADGAAFLRKVLKKWRKLAKERCPIYIGNLLDAHPELLKKSFFEPFFESPAKWLACDPFQEVPAGFFDDVRATLTGDVLSEFVSGVQDCKYRPFVSAKAFPLFQPIVDDIDLSIIDGRPPSTVREYRLYRAGAACFDSVLEGYQDPSTRVGGIDHAAHYLYQLLKRAPFLAIGESIDESIDESLDLSVLVRRYLVDRCPPTVRPTQLLLAARFDAAGTQRIPRNSDRLADWFGAMCAPREKQFEAQVVATRLQRQVKATCGTVLAISTALENALHYKFIRSQPVESLGDEAVLWPEKFHTALKNRLAEFEGVARQKFGGRQYEHLHFHILARPIDFRRFRRLNPHLQIPDRIVARAAAQDMRTTEQGVDLQRFAAFGKRLRLAYAENCDARAKANRILAVWTDAMAFFARGLKSVGPDELTSLRSAIFIRFIPSCVVSAHMFINDFFPDADKMVQEALKLLDSELSGLPPWPIGRGAQVPMVMAATGPSDDVLHVLDSLVELDGFFSWEMGEVIVSVELSDHAAMCRLRTRVGRNATPNEVDVALFVANEPISEISAAATGWLGRAPDRALKMLVVREGSQIGDARIKVVTGLGIKPMEDIRERVRNTLTQNMPSVRR
jgi:hypothetical protein